MIIFLRSKVVNQMNSPQLRGLFIIPPDDVFRLFLRHRYKRHDPRTFDHLGHAALVAGAGTGFFARGDFCKRRDEALQQLWIFIIQLIDLVHAQVAGFWS